jgi:hypothetical protein
MSEWSDHRASSPLIRTPHPNPSPAKGEGLFSDGASRLAGQVGLLLGWRPNEFWGATPAEVAAVLGAVAGGEPAGVSADEVSRLRALFPD